jgi:hypothetical protein
MINLHWLAGWLLILAGFVTGAGMGLFFHRDGFMGGYTAFPRRMLRLGHIACVALGMLNLIVAVAGHASPWLVAGSVTMPVVCFLTAWRKPCRHLFFIPVTCLMVAAIIQLCHSEFARNLSLPVRTDSRDSSLRSE